MNKKMKFICLILAISMCLTLTACGGMPLDYIGESEKTEETVKIPVDSVCNKIDEPGVYFYESSLKTERHLKAASREGDMGTIAVILSSETADFTCSTQWWTDQYEQRLGADILILAGNPGDEYRGTVSCHKCGETHEIEGVVECDTVFTLSCQCEDLNNYHGMKKILTVHNLC